MTPEFALSRTHLPLAGIYRHVHELPETAAFIDARTTLTFPQLLERIQQTAADFAARGVGRADRVAIVTGNRVEFPVVVYAAQYLGAIIVPVNFRLAPGEIAYILGDSQPSIVVADEDRMEATAAAIQQISSTAPLLPLEEVTVPPRRDDVPDPHVSAETDDMAIMYTSGTTGRPKGAVLTYGNFLSVTMRSGTQFPYTPGDDVVLLAAPMFHIAAFNNMITTISYGATSVITESTGFDAGSVLDVMEAHTVTRTFMVPAQWQMIVDEQRRKPRTISLRFFTWGAAPASEALLTALQETFPDAASQATFGQTETCAAGMALHQHDSLRKLGSVGLPDRNFSIRIVDAEMNDVPQGEVGEIVYRGPGVMDRFWNNERATEEAFAGGCFHSGDLVRQDEDGYVYVVDRVKDMIISGGENIYCAELENVIAWHPKVAEVAVVGRPDEKEGEIPVAIIVPPSDSEGPSLDEIREFCDGRLARYKLPKEVVIRDEFPRSGAGKIQKTVLRDEV